MSKEFIEAEMALFLQCKEVDMVITPVSHDHSALTFPGALLIEIVWSDGGGSVGSHS
jgi:hypothetical protein